MAGYLKHLLDIMGITLNMGVVQTAYANGASTKYITEVLVRKYEIPFQASFSFKLGSHNFILLTANTSCMCLHWGQAFTPQSSRI